MGSFNNYVDRFLSFLFPLPLPGQFLYLKRGQAQTFFDVVIECPLCTVGQIALNIFSQSTYRSIHALKLKKYLRGIQTLLCIVSIYFTYCSFKMSSLCVILRIFMGSNLFIPSNFCALLAFILPTIGCEYVRNQVIYVTYVQ